MTVHTLQAPLSPLQLAGGSRIRLEAIDPTTGAAVAGVTVTNVAIFGVDLSDEAATQAAGPLMFVPGTGEAV